MTGVAGAVAVGAGDLDLLAVKPRLAAIGWSPITIRPPDLLAVAATALRMLRVACPFCRHRGRRGLSEVAADRKSVV